MWSGRAFHKMGPATLKALLANLIRNDGSINRYLFSDLNDLFGLYRLISSHRYCGAVPRIHLYINTRILNSIRCLIGNQWSFSSSGVMCSQRRVPVMTLAALFCTCWSFWIRPSGSTHSKLLTPSNLEVTNAWITDSQACFVQFLRTLEICLRYM